VSVARFDYALASGALQFFAHVDSDAQRELLEIFRLLAAHPTRAGDFTAMCERRVNQVAQHGRFLVTYWPDHAVRELRITELARS